MVDITLETEGDAGDRISWVMQVEDLSTAEAMQLQLKSLGSSVQIPTQLIHEPPTSS